MAIQGTNPYLYQPYYPTSDQYEQNGFLGLTSRGAVGVPQQAPIVNPQGGFTPPVAPPPPARPTGFVETVDAMEQLSDPKNQQILNAFAEVDNGDFTSIPGDLYSSAFNIDSARAYRQGQTDPYSQLDIERMPYMDNEHQWMI